MNNGTREFVKWVSVGTALILAELWLFAQIGMFPP